MTERRIGESVAEAATIAVFRIELDGGAEVERLGLVRRSRDRTIADVDLEGCLGEQRAVACLPRPADDLPASFEHVVHQRALMYPRSIYRLVTGNSPPNRCVRSCSIGSAASSSGRLAGVVAQARINQSADLARNDACGR